MTQAGQSDYPNSLESVIGSELACDPSDPIQFISIIDLDTRKDNFTVFFFSEIAGYKEGVLKSTEAWSC